MKYKAVIFDMDGTILNTLEDLTDSMNFCLEEFNMPPHTIEEIRSYVGNGIHKLVERAVCPGTSSDTVELVYERFQAYYKEHAAIKTRPYDGICETLKILKEKGVKTAVVSNKADPAVRDLCRDYFEDLFDYSVGDRAGMRIKPYPDGVFEALKNLNVSASEAVYVGDSDVDYQTAQNAGMDVIMVGWGFRDEDFLKSIGVREVIHDPLQIIEKIK